MQAIGLGLAPRQAAMRSVPRSNVALRFLGLQLCNAIHWKAAVQSADGTGVSNRTCPGILRFKTSFKFLNFDQQGKNMNAGNNLIFGRSW